MISRVLLSGLSHGGSYPRSHSEIYLEVLFFCSDILATFLVAKAEDSILVKVLVETNVEEKASASAEQMSSPSALSWLQFRSLRSPSEHSSAGKTPPIKSKQLVGASSQSWAPWCSGRHPGGGDDVGPAPCYS